MKISDLILDMQIPRIDDVYYPSDDTYLLIDYLDTMEFTETVKQTLRSKSSIRIADIGCGTGILGFCLLAKSLTFGSIQNIHITFVDINPSAISAAKLLVKENKHLLQGMKGYSDIKLNIEYHISDLFKSIPNSVFDFVLFNPPYLPQDDDIKTHKPIDHALYGGSEGITVLSNFFNTVLQYIHHESVVYFIASSLGNLDQLFLDISKPYHIELIQNIHIFFEDITLFRAQKMP